MGEETMSVNKQPTAGQQAFHDVFLSHKWGNSANAGKNYRRPYSSTNSSAKEYIQACNKAGRKSYSEGRL